MNKYLFLDFDGVICLQLDRAFNKELNKNYPIFKKDLTDKLQKIIIEEKVTHIVGSSNWCCNTHRGTQVEGKGIEYLKKIFEFNGMENLIPMIVGVTNNHNTSRITYTRATEILEYINTLKNQNNKYLILDDVVDQSMINLCQDTNYSIIETDRLEGLLGTLIKY